MAALVSTTLTEPFSITFAHVGQISMNLLRFRRLKSTWLGLGKHYGLAWHKYVSSQPAWLPPNVDFSRFLYYDATVSCSTYWMLEGYLQGRCEALGHWPSCNIWRVWSEIRLTVRDQFLKCDAISSIPEIFSQESTHFIVWRYSNHNDLCCISAFHLNMKYSS